MTNYTVYFALDVEADTPEQAIEAGWAFAVARPRELRIHGVSDELGEDATPERV